VKCPRPIILGGLAVVAVAVATVVFTSNAVEPTPPSPAPATTGSPAALPRGVQPFVADLGGERYRFLLYFSSGIDCDWGHPLSTPSPSPSPAASRTPR
jgi:hypothetical protein